MNLRSLAFLVFASCTFFISGCNEAGERDTNSLISELLEDIYQADPTSDFQKAIKIKDYRFMGVYGVGRIVPNVSDCLAKEFNVSVIEGTSDAHENYEHAKLQALAHVYASTYNLYMLRYIIENDLSVCERGEKRSVN